MAETANFDDLCDRARRHLRAREFREAIALFQEACEQDDQQVELYEGLATAHFLLGDCEAAIAHFRRVTELAPRRASAYINQGAVYNRMGNYEKAVEVLRRGLQLDQRSAEGYYNLGIAYRRSQQLPMAVTAYREAVRLNPRFAEAFQNLGNVYFDMANYPQALVHFKKALDIRPQFEAARNGLAATEAAIQSAKQAENPFGRLVADAPPPREVASLASCRLNPEERELDRQAVYSILIEIGANAGRLLELLRDHLEPGIREMDRTLMQETTNPRAAAASREKLGQFISRYDRESRRLAGTVRELRDHETRMLEKSEQVPAL